MEQKLRSTERQATRLRELMRNRFSQEIALKLIIDFSGEQEALDFLLNEDDAVVHQYLHQSPEYLEGLRKDSQNLASILKNGFESSVRMFGCGTCVRTWWKKVPHRKEVDKCSRCKVKYDPIPRDKEWGWGKFICQCGNEFTGFATMGETESVCFKCNIMCPVDHILPPRKRNKTNKSRTPHTCNGINCYNRDADDCMHPGQSGYAGGYVSGQALDDLNRNFAGMSMNNKSSNSGPAGAYPGQAPPPMCVHPKSLNPKDRKLRCESRRHHSTGSTVTNAMSQGSVYTESISSNFFMNAINEED